MKIGYCGNFTQPHCTEVHLAATLEDLGHEVVRIQEDVRRDLLDWVRGCDLFLFTRTWGNTVTIGQLIKLRELGIPSVSYHLDLYVGLAREGLHGGKSIEEVLTTDPFWRTDFVFTPDGDPASQAVFKANGVNHHYMKPGVYKGECYILEKIDGWVGDDVIFVGGGVPTGEEPQYGHPEWPYRGKLLKWLKDTYGSRYTKYGHPEPTIRNNALNQLYTNSKVVVGDSLCLNFNHPYYWSDRAYETLGRGGFLIHPYIKGMEEEFIDGVHLRYYEYNNWKQLKYLIDYYLSHDDEREKIRLAGHEKVKADCTYNDRLTKMLEIVGRV